jgi:hypothetical protein
MPKRQELDIMNYSGTESAAQLDENPGHNQAEPSQKHRQSTLRCDPVCSHAPHPYSQLEEFPGCAARLRGLSASPYFEACGGFEFLTTAEIQFAAAALDMFAIAMGALCPEVCADCMREQAAMKLDEARGALNEAPCSPPRAQGADFANPPTAR